MPTVYHWMVRGHHAVRSFCILQWIRHLIACCHVGRVFQECLYLTSLEVLSLRNGRIALCICSSDDQPHSLGIHNNFYL